MSRVVVVTGGTKGIGQAVARAPACSGEPECGAVRYVRIGLPELSHVAGRLLEVVADDLVALDERLSVVVEPGGEAEVQIGADRLGERVVGGVANQQVAKAVAVVAGKLGELRTDELTAHERG